MAQVPDSDRERSAVAEYLRHMCHELRQPLVVAVGYISMLEEGSMGELPPEALPVLRIVAERLDAMNAIIDRVGEDTKGWRGVADAS
jgi:signal transduction histidine kinase